MKLLVDLIFGGRLAAALPVAMKQEVGDRRVLTGLGRRGRSVHHLIDALGKCVRTVAFLWWR